MKGHPRCPLSFRSGSSTVTTHYYEAEDAFTRHIDPKLKEASHPVGATGRQATADRRRAGELIHPEPDLRPLVGKPGALDEYFRGPTAGRI